jgi:serine/threonine protein kinase
MFPGDVIDERFEVERFVARGGMGDVYRARDRATGKIVALKFLIDEQEALLHRLDREARVLAALDHPGIVAYVAHRATRGSAYLAMEWLDGVSLAEHVARGRLTVDQTLALGICVRCARDLRSAA